jgi:hypothetical protein
MTPQSYAGLMSSQNPSIPMGQNGNTYAGLRASLSQNSIGNALSSIGNMQEGGGNKYKLTKQNFFLTK